MLWLTMLFSITSPAVPANTNQSSPMGFRCHSSSGMTHLPDSIACSLTKLSPSVTTKTAAIG
jgi:hypothetical protein